MGQLTISYNNNDLLTTDEDGSFTLATNGKIMQSDLNVSVSGITPSGSLSITENGTYDVTEKAFAVVAVPNTYAAADEGKVVSSGALVAQSSDTVTVNGTVDTTLINSLTVNVPQGTTPTGTKQISIGANGTTTEDVTSYASAQITVNVPNSYAAADEGKVVSNGALVAQTSDSVTQNGTVDTTLINSLTVNVSGGGGLSGSITFTENTNFNGYSIAVGADFDYFAIYAASNPRNIVGGRTFCGLFKNFAANTDLNGMYIATNYGGSAYSGSLGISQATKSGQSVVFNTTDGGKFASGITYNWFAW